MASYDIPANALANGDITGENAFTLDSADPLPLVSFLESLGPGVIDTAVITLSVSDENIGTADVDGDGDGDSYFINQTPIESFYIDTDGDGTPEYRVLAENENQRMMQIDLQYNGNVVRFNGPIGVYDYPDGTTVVHRLSNGNLTMTSDPAGFPAAGDFTVVPQAVDGQPVFVTDDLVVICFTRGTLIETPDGPRPVEEFRVGDLVQTLDHGAKAIQWIGNRAVSTSALRRQPNLCPIRIRAGALGPGLPASDLIVSPQHRIMLSSRIVAQMFDTDEVLVPARKLLGLPGVEVVSGIPVEYFHILLDGHEIVIANGAPCETLLLGRMALRALGIEARREIALLFPEIDMPTYVPPTARRLAEPRRIAKLVERHVKNGRHVLDAAPSSLRA